MRVYFSARLVLVAGLMSAFSSFTIAARSYSATGLVLKVDPDHKSIVVSCNAIPGVMDAMDMSLAVVNPKQLDGVNPGTMIEFTLITDASSVRAESIRIRPYQGMEPDPLAANRLKLLSHAVHTSLAKPVALGQAVPDFTLLAQDGHRVELSNFRGKVVALDFVYTRCALPNFCARSSGNFSSLQKRFRSRLAKDLVLLTVTFDPVHDSPEILEKYAKVWHADPAAWHFLTGTETEIRRVCDLFGEDYFPDEGLMDHSLHTAVIDRNGRLIANIEGNEFTSVQLGDLVQSVLNTTRP